MKEQSRNCDICGKSFRGHDPLTDGKRYSHTKCAPKPDVAGMRKAVEVFFKQHGIDGITTGSRKKA
jgi:hypothetical protein